MKDVRSLQNLFDQKNRVGRAKCCVTLLNRMHEQSSVLKADVP